ncbi:MAG: hypothetical protein V4510_06955 [bacterium]
MRLVVAALLLVAVPAAQASCTPYIAVPTDPQPWQAPVDVEANFDVFVGDPMAFEAAVSGPETLHWTGQGTAGSHSFTLTRTGTYTMRLYCDGTLVKTSSFAVQSSGGGDLGGASGGDSGGGLLPLVFATLAVVGLGAATTGIIATQRRKARSGWRDAETTWTDAPAEPSAAGEEPAPEPWPPEPVPAGPAAPSRPASGWLTQEAAPPPQDVLVPLPPIAGDPAIQHEIKEHWVEMGPRVPWASATPAAGGSTLVQWGAPADAPGQHVVGFEIREVRQGYAGTRFAEPTRVGAALRAILMPQPTAGPPVVGYEVVPLLQDPTVFGAFRGGLGVVAHL